MLPPREELLHLIRETEALITGEDQAQISNILTVMSIDNEEEAVLDFISETGSADFVDLLIQAAPRHVQPHARWQCAELIRRRRPKHSMSILRELLQDSNEYVVKRAENAYAELTQQEDET